MPARRSDGAIDERQVLAQRLQQQADACRALGSPLYAHLSAEMSRAGAGSWLTEHLDAPRRGIATMMFHSIMWQYMPPDEQQQVRARLAEVGEAATADAPLAWLRMEPPVRPGPDAMRDGLPAEPNFAAPGFKAQDLADVHLTLWPDGETRLVAKGGYHGRPVVWRGWGS